MNANSLGFKGNLGPGCEPRCNKIFDDLLLGIDRNRATCQLFEIDAMTSSVEANFYAIMNQSFTLHSAAYAHIRQQFDGALLQDSCSDALFTVQSSSRLDHDGMDTFAMQKLRQDKPGRSCADDPHLCAYFHCF